MFTPLLFCMLLAVGLQGARYDTLNLIELLLGSKTSIYGD